METTTIENEVIDSEKLLYTNEQEINRVTQEAEARARLLNNILSYGLVTNESLKEINSTQAIDTIIFNEQLKVNKVLAADYKAGRNNLMDAFALPQNLQALKDALVGWITYSFTRAGKYEHLTFSADRWIIDNDSLERYFLRQRWKLYLNTPGQHAELQTLLTFQAYFLAMRAEVNQVYTSKFWTDRFTSDSSLACNQLPPAKYMIRYSYFMSDRNN